MFWKKIWCWLLFQETSNKSRPQDLFHPQTLLNITIINAWLRLCRCRLRSVTFYLSQKTNFVERQPKQLVKIPKLWDNLANCSWNCIQQMKYDLFYFQNIVGIPAFYWLAWMYCVIKRGRYYENRGLESDQKNKDILMFNPYQIQQSVWQSA